MTQSRPRNRLREFRASLGLTQSQLADRAGISRTSVTAIEGERLVPSVEAALALAGALGRTVEEIFGTTAPVEAWAWRPASDAAPCWSAAVGDRRVLFPASTTPLLTPLPSDQASDQDTLVIASCDPAAGLLSTLFAEMTGLRMLAIPRSSRTAIEMLREGLVHMAGVHFATPDAPDENSRIAGEMLGAKFRMARVAHWEEGSAAPSSKLKTIRAASSSRLTWVGREAGSGARQCLDRILPGRRPPRRAADSHRGVAEAVRSGWADAGVCVAVVCAEAGLRFLPVQEEALDLCYPASLVDDHRIRALLQLLQSPACRGLFADLPGYDTREMGETWEVG